MHPHVVICGYSHHAAPFRTTNNFGKEAHLLRLQTEGKSVVVVNGETVHQREGDLLVIAPGDSYELYTGDVPSGDYHLAVEGDEFVGWDERLVHTGVDVQVTTIWQYIILERRRPRDEWNEEVIAHLLKTLLLFIDRARQREVAEHTPYIVREMMRYVEQNATETFAVADVAVHVGLSTSRALHLFKAHTGQTIVGYTHHVQVGIAKERMMRTDHSLQQIAGAAGFSSYTYFYKIFKRYTGMAPGAYRLGQKLAAH
ncbi:LOW QUALITY PROTEIN: transcriptional regulator, AraC family [Geomicrobium sp. JCM 19037]|nr:LOW QUALITY PROTEIN: transcriptional regulator, AraC family [Geomicrobium sp. JCM 19037]